MTSRIKMGLLINPVDGVSLRKASCNLRFSASVTAKSSKLKVDQRWQVLWQLKTCENLTSFVGLFRGYGELFGLFDAHFAVSDLYSWVFPCSSCPSLSLRRDRIRFDWQKIDDDAFVCRVFYGVSVIVVSADVLLALLRGTARKFKFAT